MSRRNVTTLTIALQLRIPPGSNAAAVLKYIESALQAHKTREKLTDPISAIDLDSAKPRITKRETIYI